jgi:quinol monooxygenase YgiN
VSRLTAVKWQTTDPNAFDRGLNGGWFAVLQPLLHQSIELHGDGGRTMVHECTEPAYTWTFSTDDVPRLRGSAPEFQPERDVLAVRAFDPAWSKGELTDPATWEGDVVIFTRFLVPPVSIAEFLDLLDPSRPIVAAEPGTKQYAVNAGESAVDVLEIFTDEEAMRAHTQTPEHQVLIRKLAILLSGPIDKTVTRRPMVQL